MKKLSVIILVLALVLSSFCFASCKGKDDGKETKNNTESADETKDAVLKGRLTFDKTEVKPGENVTATLFIESNPGFNVLIINFSFPSGLFVKSEGTLADGCDLDVTFDKNIIIDAGYSDSNYKGEVFKITYTVGENASEGEYGVEVFSDAANYDEMTVESSFVSPSLTVKK